MVRFLFLPSLRILCCSTMAIVGLAACEEEQPPGPEPLAGARPGTQRFVVYLAGDPPDASAYRAALKDDPSSAPPLAEALRAQAEAQRRGFQQALRAYNGVVVDHWWLTNAVTVEIPTVNAASLTAIDGVVRVEPDVLFPE
ncbi:MAG: hypothetical protein ACO3JL_20035 [Myxococcota bacterium]